MGILYRTKLYTPPVGKPRVFMVCHKDDFVTYSESVFNDIFRESNCVVYYLDPLQEYTLDDVLADLSEMQLFVFVVTKRLLSDSDQSLDPFLDYAFDNSIPILPLVQETIDLENYHQEFGEIQFLEKNPVLESSISYSEQLNKYLTSVLVSDEIASKVRAAFDAYIFMSYRKIDRRYASQLMHMIHEHEIFRDVAIWYDEFLVPGENFNNAILDMIDRSEFFALSVTPNLVLESNYVMGVEYPAALKLNKKMAAFEMEKTDLSELNKYYQDFPGCVDPYKEGEIERVLMDAFDDIRLHTKNSSDHLLAIGAAYLWGIDVEVDHVKARSLITKAAMSGNMDAISLLAMMYTTGFGVNMDYNQAVQLYEKFIDLAEKIENFSDEVRSNGKYIDSLFNLSELYKRNKDYDQQKEMLDKTKQIYDQYLPNLAETVKMKIQMMLGENAANRGDYESAKKILSDTVEQSRKSIDKDDGEMFTRSSSMLGDLYQKSGDIDLADQCFIEIEKVQQSLKNSKIVQQSQSAVEKVMDNIQEDIEKLHKQERNIRNLFKKEDE